MSFGSLLSILNVVPSCVQGVLGGSGGGGACVSAHSAGNWRQLWHCTERNSLGRYKETGGSYGIALNETQLAGKEPGGSYGIALKEIYLAGIRKLEAAMASH